MNKNNLLIILPSAGKGKRLGLNKPKELFEIFKGINLIDLSINHILQYLENNTKTRCRVAVIVSPGKESVFQYVKAKLKQIKVEMVYFNSQLFEWPGSVFSAHEIFADNNIVLLPDSYIGVGSPDYLKNSKGNGLIKMAENSLERCNVSFGYVKENSKEKLSTLGAVKAVGNIIVEFWDKPEADFSSYNGFWASYCFKKDQGAELYDFLIRSVRHELNNFRSTSFYPAAGFELDCFHDLGTWDNINFFKKKFAGKFKQFVLHR